MPQANNKKKNENCTENSKIKIYNYWSEPDI